VTAAAPNPSTSRRLMAHVRRGARTAAVKRATTPTTPDMASSSVPTKNWMTTTRPRATPMVTGRCRLVTNRSCRHRKAKGG
jgi:hypothetical protein